MNLRHLEVFCTVVACESYSAAAEQLFMTQPAVSMQVQAVSGYFGVQLLERRNRRMVLTEAGQVVYRWAQEVLRSEAETRKQVDALRQAEGGRVVIGASMTVGSYVLPRILSRFKRDHPAAEIVLRLGERDEIGVDVLTGAVDCAVMVARNIPPGLEVEVLGAEEMVLICPPTHRLAAVPCATVEDLVDEPFIMAPRGSNYRSMIDELLAQKGLERISVLMELDGTEGVKRGVQQGLGIALAMRTGVETELEHGLIAEVRLPPPPLTVDLGLVRRPRQRFSPILEAFIAYLREQLQEHLVGVRGARPAPAPLPAAVAPDPGQPDARAEAVTPGDPPDA